MNEQDKYVTFEQAEMLAKEFQFRTKCKHCYDANTKEFLESREEFNHNHPTWAGVNGWKYARYSAPTKDEAISFLFEIGILMHKELYENFKENGI